jgi:hypothetical protein
MAIIDYRLDRRRNVVGAEVIHAPRHSPRPQGSSKVIGSETEAALARSDAEERRSARAVPRAGRSTARKHWKASERPDIDLDGMSGLPIFRASVLPKL